ncbi:sugar O-acyltransferase, sialic acid O-acetyltransferase NeuD family [Marinobacter antarcticus]|uniref:Sugar O-acyltransferase, sialic acid O-acetyltransferase NeuD family n=1 Tax=Marinobacter antarcticus TaxID=564117 RepID=A0A1M6RX29_9GAMM|nr:acetyltransferase [Marinobacter antarcticus]SHK37001.1 sugar O-acyltransferase, sialic acid O-acetyltransferase NeuD family [Marinobacter antarcticus]
MRLAILGASGHGKVVADAAEHAGWQSVVFFDDAWPGLQVNGPWAVEGSTEALIGRLTDFDGVVVAIGNNRIRSVKQAELVAAGGKMATIVHPSATVSVHAFIDEGSLVFAHAVVNACATVGAGVIINTGAVVEHDCAVGNFAHISPNAVLAGGVTLGPLAWVGSCASVRQLIAVGEASVVGMGAVVTRDVISGVTVVGNPAKVKVVEPRNQDTHSI